MDEFRESDSADITTPVHETVHIDADRMLPAEIDRLEDETVRPKESPSEQINEDQRATLIEMRDSLRTQLDDREDALLKEKADLASRAALRERSLIAERDQYARQLNQIYSTKAWRMSTAVRSARSKGILAPLYLARTCFKYALRVGYNLAVPFTWRRELWYRHHTGLSYNEAAAREKEVLAKSAEQERARKESLLAARANASALVAAVGPDIICLPGRDWEVGSGRSQQLTRQFARMGHRCYYLNTHFTGFDQSEVCTRAIGSWLNELCLPGDSEIIIDRDRLGRATLRRALGALQAFCSREDVCDAVCIVQHPFWEPLVSALKQAYGWKIVYEYRDRRQCLDTSKEASEQEDHLVGESDLLIATSRVLYDEKSPHQHNWVLLTDAADYEHFTTIPSRERSPIAHLPGPVIGYSGEISEWIDLGSVAAAASQHPEWSLVLIGPTSGADLSELEALPNVHVLGEKPYDVLPYYIAGFDICMMPFQRTPLTLTADPVKLFEYLATGKPVVARNLPEFESYGGVVSLYEQPGDFVCKLESALRDDDAPSAARRMGLARQNSWAMRAETLMTHIRTLYGRASIIVLTYSNTSKTVLTLNSILEKTRYPNYNIIVVDNGGREDLRRLLDSVADRHPTKVTTVFNKQNIGFAAGNNIGIDLATGSDYIVLLNDDVIVTPGWLGRLIWHLRDQEVGMIGPVTNSCANEACISVDYTTLSDIDAFTRRYCTEHQGQLFDIAVLAMYCVALRREVVDKIGRLDERFSVGMFEDDDYAMRLRQAGYRVVCAEDVFVHHFGNSSFGKMADEEYRKLFTANRALFEQKWGLVWQEHKYREGYQPGEWRD